MSSPRERVSLGRTASGTKPARRAANSAASLPAEPAGNRYTAALRALAPSFGAVLGFSAILNVLMLTGSLYMLQVYDRVLTSGSVPTLVGLFLIVVLLYVFLGFYDFLRARMMSRVALRLDHSCGKAAYRAWLAPESVRPTAPPLRDLDTVRGYLGSPAVGAMFDLPFVPLFLGVLFLVHPALGWLTAIGAVVSGALAILTRRLTEASIARSAALDSIERGFAEQSHRTAETLRAMRMEEAAAARWVALRAEALAAAQKGSDPSEALASASRAFRMLLQSGILTLGAFLVIRGEISGGMIIASSVLSGRALAPVDQLIGQWRVIGRARAAHRRLVQAFDRIRPAPAPLKLPNPTGAISLRRLTVLAPGQSRTADAEPQTVLKEINLELAAGDGLGVIGRSASGKSTLARILVGAQHPDRGEIRYDGATPEQWDPQRLGRMLGYLPQHVEMLPGTARDNIAQFDAGISDKAVIEAACRAGVHWMILRFPDGYSTRLGEAGAPQLSGGQMQRLGLARAICGNPRIVVLDEPNSNLDPEGENALIDTIAALRRNGTTVVVMAHRPSVLAAVDKLLVIEAGEVHSFGSKAEVMAKFADRTGEQGRPQVRSVPMEGDTGGGIHARHLTEAPIPDALAHEIPANDIPSRHVPPAAANATSGAIAPAAPVAAAAPAAATAGAISERQMPQGPRTWVARTAGPAHRRKLRS